MSSEAKDKAWEEVQKKAFTHWVNTILEKRAKKVVNSLEDTLSDGVTVIDFVELLCEKKLKKKFTQNPKQRIQVIENTHLALNFLKENGVEPKYLTVASEDLVDKNLKLILGFLWMLFRKFRIAKQMGVEDVDSTTEGLLNWVREVTTGYKGVNIRDFKSSFSDGNAFLALVHAFDKSLFNYNERLEEHSTLENIEASFDMAEKTLGIPQLLDPQELADGTIDERSVVLYVSLYFHAFVSAQEKNKIEGEKKAITEKVTDLETQLIEANEQVEILNKKLSNKEEEIADWKNKYSEKEKEAQTLAKEKEALETENADLRDKYKKLKELMDERQALELRGLDELRKNLLEHLRDMGTWKGYLEQNREYDSETIQNRTEKDIADRSFEDQLDHLSEALATENKKLEGLLKAREIEEQLAAEAEEAERKAQKEREADIPKKPEGSDEKKKKKKDDDDGDDDTNKKSKKDKKGK